MSDLLLRATAGKVMARPDYAQIQPGLGLDQLNFRARSGNVNLDPFRSTNLNVSLEWYFAPQSLLSATLFYMDIKNYIVDRNYVERHAVTYTDIAGTVNIRARGGCTAETTVTVYTCTFDVTRPSNGAGGVNKGVEFSYQQPVWGGIGFMLNYTYSNAKSDAGEVIPGNSQDTVNFSVYFENPSLSARLSYNYRSEFFDTIYWGGDVWVDKQKYVDGSVTYNVNKNVGLSLEATNLLDEVGRTYYNQDRGMPKSVSYTGREFYAGVRVSF
jgi:iron complex outermembrane receptor protein